VEKRVGYWVKRNRKEYGVMGPVQEKWTRYKKGRILKNKYTVLNTSLQFRKIFTMAQTVLCSWIFYFKGIVSRKFAMVLLVPLES
jgi:hypothetical protein